LTTTLSVKEAPNCHSRPRVEYNPETMPRRGLQPIAPARSVSDTAQTLPPVTGHLWAALVDQPRVPADPFGAPTIRMTASDRIQFDVAECTGELRPRQFLETLTADVMRDSEVLGYEPVGVPLPAFREAGYEYLARRGVATEQSITLVTSGAAGSLALLARALVPTGTLIAVEHPTWHVALAVFAATGVPVVAIPVDDEGIRVDVLARVLEEHRVSLIYLQPAFQNPTGVSLSGERRAAVVELARRHRAALVEDDFAAELAYDRVPSPLRTAEAFNEVIYVKSFSKLAAPAFRAAVIVAPNHHERALRQAQHGLDPFPSALAQAVLARYLPSREFQEHTKRVASMLAARWEALDSALQTHMPDRVRWTSPQGGLCAWVEFPGEMAALELLVDVAAEVDFCPGSVFCLENSGKHAARIAFGATAPPAIARGVGRLARAVRERLRNPTRPPHAAPAPAP